MLIKRVKNVVDVFVGIGWDNWCRFIIVSDKGKKLLKKVKGVSIPKEDMQKLRRIYERH